MLNDLIFHHIGIACFEIEKTIDFYLQMGFIASSITEDPIQDIRICFLEKEGMPKIELLEPIDEKSPTNRILQTQGVTPYHICYETEELQSAVKCLRQQGFVKISKIVPACAINNRKVVFLFKKDVGVIELLEKGEK